MIIAIPTCNRISYVKDSLLSVYADLASCKGKHYVIIADNHSTDGTAELVEKMLDDWKHPRISMMKFTQNLGKAVAVNMAFAKETMDWDDTSLENMVLCSFDSDLVINCLNGMQFFDRLEDTFIKSNISFKIGALCVDQTENSQHIYSNFKHNVKVPRTDESIYVLANQKGLAGGCLATYAKDYARLKGYRTDLGIFGGNDGFYLGGICRKLHMKLGLMTSISVRHPVELDPAYDEWKKKCRADINATGSTSEKGYYV